MAILPYLLGYYAVNIFILWQTISVEDYQRLIAFFVLLAVSCWHAWLLYFTNI